MKKDIINVTQKAKEQIRALLSQRGKESLGIRLGVKTRGCSGYSYKIEYADEAQPMDEVIDCEDFKILIEPKAVLFFVGTTMDYVDEKLSSGFVFNNPNEKGRCGCGESFHV